MDDLISRKALLDIVGKIPLSWEYGQAISDVYEIIKSMPTLTLDDLRPTGRWGDYEPYPDGYRCSHCKLMHRSCTAYCPNCGADMRGGGEDEY